MITVYTINLRDSNSKNWAMFWQAEQGSKPIKRFGFRIAFDKDRTSDVKRLSEVLKEQMKIVKEIMRYEDLNTIGYQVMHKTKASRAMTEAIKQFDRLDSQLSDWLRQLRI